MTVTDSKGASTTEAVTVVVGDPPANQAPTVEITADARTGASPLTVHFTSHASDPEKRDMLYRWEFGDGEFGAGADVMQTYNRTGTFTAKLTLRDPGGLSASATVQIVVTGSAIAGQSPDGDTASPRRRRRPGSASANRRRPASRRSPSAASRSRSPATGR